DRMAPGSIAELALREDMAFQAGFPDGKIPPQSELYWRGMVLWRGEGLTWVRSDALIRDSRPGPLTGEPVRQQVVLQPHGGHFIFALDRPAIAMSRGMTMEPGGYLRSQRPVISPLKYEVTSRPISREQRLPADQLAAALWKPRELSPLVNALAQSWRDESSSDEEVIERGLKYFAEEGFFYSLQPGTYEDNGLEDFLFRRRIGFCEHYAGAFATLMRLAGVPSRVILGYHGGQYNTFGQLVTVRQSDAHAWCEVWVKGVGWKRVDPTNVIAPERISAGLEQYLEAQAGGEAGGAAGVMRNSGFRIALRDARLLWDNISYQWDLRVLNFDEESQQAFMLWIGVGSLDWTSLTFFLSVAVIVVLSVLGLILRKPAKRAEVAALRVYDRFCLLLARRGVMRELSEPPKSYVDRAAARLPDLAPAIHRVGDAYVRHRFARNPAPLEELLEALRQFEQVLRDTRRSTSRPEPI
ncbi:MAG: transglutaminase TgpA family protein, partial [Chthoniobacteraceae bacterium]